jgi:hypothetical protein
MARQEIGDIPQTVEKNPEWAHVMARAEHGLQLHAIDAKRRGSAWGVQWAQSTAHSASIAAGLRYDRDRIEETYCRSMPEVVPAASAEVALYLWDGKNMRRVNLNTGGDTCKKI